MTNLNFMPVQVDNPEGKPPIPGLRRTLYTIIFEAETPKGKAFDIALLIFIVLSVLAVMLETVYEIDQSFHKWFIYSEWVLTILFTLEYFTRIYCVERPLKYIFSFYGVIDLLAILPTYLSIIFVGSQYLLTIRAIRLLRVFRIFKLARYLSESKLLLAAIKASRHKIIVFLIAVFAIVIFVGSLMYLVEGEAGSGFTSIPRSIYWAVVTVTTVGYGDITPVTAIGQMLSAGLMVLGYAMIAVPTGIVSVEIAEAVKQQEADKLKAPCNNCKREGHDLDAGFCKYCGTKL